MNKRSSIPPVRKSVATKSVPDEEVRQRIEELKHRDAPVEPVPLFHYDPNEPLHLLPKIEKSDTPLE